MKKGKEFNMLEIRTEVITPEIAKNYLSKSIGNRQISPGYVQSIARDMKNGTCFESTDAIGFDEDGHFINGHHRLLGVIKANIPVRMSVARGVSKHAIESIDRGMTRTVKHVIEMKQIYGEYNDVDYQILGKNQVISCLNTIIKQSLGIRGKITVSDATNAFNTFKDSMSDIYSEVISKITGSKRAGITAAALAARECGVPIDAIGKFMQVFYKDDVCGCDNYNVTAALNWKRQLDDAKIHKVIIDNRKLYLGTQNAIYHFVNNTNVTRIVVPDTARYDVTEKVNSFMNNQA